MKPRYKLVKGLLQREVDGFVRRPSPYHFTPDEISLLAGDRRIPVPAPSPLYRGDAWDPNKGKPKCKSCGKVVTFEKLVKCNRHKCVVGYTDIDGEISSAQSWIKHAQSLKRKTQLLLTYNSN